MGTLYHSLVMIVNFLARRIWITFPRKKKYNLVHWSDFIEKWEIKLRRSRYQLYYLDSSSPVFQPWAVRTFSPTLVQEIEWLWHSLNRHWQLCLQPPSRRITVKELSQWSASCWVITSLASKRLEHRCSNQSLDCVPLYTGFYAIKRVLNDGNTTSSPVICSTNHTFPHRHVMLNYIYY